MTKKNITYEGYHNGVIADLSSSRYSKFSSDDKKLIETFSDFVNSVLEKLLKDIRKKSFITGDLRVIEVSKIAELISDIKKEKIK